MDNDRQQASQFSSQWSYNDQEQSPGSPAEPLNARNLAPGYPSQAGNNELSPALPYDPDLTMDMGNSLGYSQAMEYHANNIPQPTHSMQRIHQKRFQQLRGERMRRQQNRTHQDLSTLRQRKRLRLPGNKNAFSSLFTKRSAPDAQSRSVASAIAAADLVNLSPAATSVQDTGKIQRVKVARAAFLITGALMFSSVLGLLRTFLFPYALGANNFSNDYLQAYIIPNLLYTVVSGGALSSAFIPVFIKYSDGLKDEKTAWHIASSALNLCVAIMIILSAAAMILAPVLVPLYSPGYTPADLAWIVTLTRITLLQAIVLGSGVIVSAVLNAKQDFMLTAIGTVLYNVGQILGFLPGFFLAIHTGSSTPGELAIYSATWGVVLGAVLQVSVQIPGLFKFKMRYTFSFDWHHPGVRQIGRQMIPRTINAAMLSFSTAVDRILLSFLSALISSQVHAITDYFLAFSIFVLPVSIFGSSVSTAAFPALTSYVARERFDRVRSIIMETLRGILFLSLPSCVGLIILALSIIQVLLEHGGVNLRDAQFMTIPLIFFALGLPGLAAVEILTRAFYALRDSKTPVIISVTQFILKIALSIVLIDVSVFGVQWGMGALAFSTSIASTLEAGVLFILLHRRIGGFDLRALASFLGRSLLASIAMGVVLLFVRTGLDHLIQTTSGVPTSTLSIRGIFLALIKFLIELAIGALTFLIAARRLKIEEVNSGPVRRILILLHISWL